MAPAKYKNILIFHETKILSNNKNQTDAICESTWIKSLVAPDLINDLWSGHSRLGAANGAGQNGACVVVPKFFSVKVNYFGQTSGEFWRRSHD